MEGEKSVCVKVYLNPKLFTEVAEAAEKAGIRRKGLELYTQKEHGFSHEKLANTDGISEYLKHCHQYRLDHLAFLFVKKSELARKQAEIETEKKQWGIEL
jgi:hypothetical protein